jgi:hypothetical protein
MNGRDFWAMSQNERQEYVAKNRPAKYSQLDKVEQGRIDSTTINPLLDLYFKVSIDEDKKHGQFIDNASNQEKKIKELFDVFITEKKDKVIDIFSNLKSFTNNPSNIYEYAKTPGFILGNKVTRDISESLGHIWEDVASLSPYAVSPDDDFLFKIAGIDIIAKHISTGKIEYLQIKTKENTLTGSQKDRSVNELLVHENPVFATALRTSSGWTFSQHDQITRVAGKEFWERIGISYEFVLKHSIRAIKELHDEWSRLI